MRSTLAVLVIAGLVVTACGEPEPAGGALPPPSDVTTVIDTTVVDATVAESTPGLDGPYDPSAETRPELMVISPNPVDAGGMVAVAFPEGTSRGVAYVMEKRVQNEWHPEFLMSAATDGYGGKAATWSIGAPGRGWEDIGIEGPGPDTLLIPESALHGDYRICTANAVENICAELTVVKVDDSPMPVEPDGGIGDGAGSVHDEWLYGVGHPELDTAVGSPLEKFEGHVALLGWGPVRVAVENGEPLELQDDLVAGRVNVAVEGLGDTAVVVAATVEVTDDWQPGDPVVEAAIVDVFDGVDFYPACGNEPLVHGGVVWHQVQANEYPEVYERAANGYREPAPESVTVHGLAPRVAAPGPGDDVGTLVVWSDGVAYFVSDSGDLHAWLVRDELTYDWVC